MVGERTRVAVLGAAGRMGQRVAAAVAAAPDLALVAAVGRPGSPAGREAAGVPIAPLGPGCFGDADVVVDFSLPDGLALALPELGARALVSGTTGLDEALLRALDLQAERGPVLTSANFSLGIAVLTALVREAAAALSGFDLEIVEAHHRRKRDAPSGTALALAAAAEAGRRDAGADGLVQVHGRSGIVGERPRAEIGVHAVRGGDVIGEHTVLLLGDGERLTLAHAASSRDTFVFGAVAAARWIAGRPVGRYYLAQVLGLDSPHG